MKKSVLLAAAALLLCLALPAFALTDAEVENAARAYVPADAVLQKIKLDDGLYELKFIVEATRERFEVQVDPADGRVVELESERKGAGGSKAVTLTGEEIAQAVQAAYPGAETLRTDETVDDGLYRIEVFFRSDGLYGTLELDAETGAILERKIYFGRYLEGGMMTEAAARAALLSLKPDAAITKLKLDEDDGEYFWEGHAAMNGSKYEFSINAMTGSLVEWKRD